MEILDHAVFRVTRDADFTVSDEADDLLQAVEAGAAPPPLRRGRARRGRRGHDRGDARADHARRWRSSARGRLRVRRAARPQRPLGHRQDRPATRSCATRRGRPSRQPRLQPDEDEQPDVMAAMRSATSSLHHPYDSFVDLGRALRRAGGRRPRRARDQADRCTARSDDSPLVPALIRAAERGKQVVVPGRAQGALRRARNIQWARALEEAGVHVVYGAARRSRRTRSASSSSAARATACAATCTSAPATTTPRPRACTPTSACSPATSEIGADVADCSTSSPGFARPRGYRQACSSRRAHARGRSLERDRARDRGARRTASARGSGSR